MPAILIVDDDADLREALCEALADFGFETLGAGQGREALEVLRGPRGGRVRLVLLDLMMPVMTGWEFRAEQLRDAALAALPVVVMTAAANLTQRPVSAAAVLRKPVTLDRLLATVVPLMGPQTEP